jgi:hypothetical protein
MREEREIGIALPSGGGGGAEFTADFLKGGRVDSGLCFFICFLIFFVIGFFFVLCIMPNVTRFF